MADGAGAITTLEIIDTAVKVGLGALISAVLAYFLAGAAHKREIAKHAFTRRTELLEKVANDVENCWNRSREFYLVSVEYLVRLRKDEHIPGGMVEEYYDRSAKVRESTSALSAADSLLLLLGEVEAHDKLLEFSTAAETYMRKTADPQLSPQMSELNALHEAVLTRRNEFFKELASAYRKMSF